MSEKLEPEEEYARNHDQLLSGSPLVLGKIHYLILKADYEMEQLRKEDDFSKEVGTDEIHWWVFNKEEDREELRKRTESVLVLAQKLKEDSFALKKLAVTDSYSNLVMKLKEFCDTHSRDLDELHTYVMWLGKKDRIAPRILFSYRVWGSTRLADRALRRIRNQATDEDQIVRLCTEIALGLRTREVYTIGSVYSEIFAERADAADPEYQLTVTVPKGTLLS